MLAAKIMFWVFLNLCRPNFLEDQNFGSTDQQWWHRGGKPCTRPVPLPPPYYTHYIHLPPSYHTHYTNLPPPYPAARRARYPAIPVSYTRLTIPPMPPCPILCIPIPGYTRLTIPSMPPCPQPFPNSRSTEHSRTSSQSQPLPFVFHGFMVMHH